MPLLAGHSRLLVEVEDSRIRGVGEGIVGIVLLLLLSG